MEKVLSGIDAEIIVTPQETLSERPQTAVSRPPWTFIKATSVKAATIDRRHVKTRVYAHTIKDNHGVIGSVSGSVTILNGSAIQDQQSAKILRIFAQLAPVDRARLLLYANTLVSNEAPQNANLRVL